MSTSEIFAADTIVWPLCYLLGCLCVVYIAQKFYQDVRPIVVGVRDGVAKQAQSNAPAYAICILFGLSASASAFIDVFHQLSSEALRLLSWHQYATLWVKVFNPFIVAVLAYATQNKFVKSPGSAVAGSTSTEAPFPPAPK